MPERIVVSFRGIAAAERRTGDAPAEPSAGAGAEPSAGGSYLRRALALKQRAEALGATLCAWGPQSFSFDLGPDELEEAISLGAMAADDLAVGAEERFAVGIAQGEMTPVGEWGRNAVLSWGQPLLAAVLLARIAGAGEILIDPRLPAARTGELLFAGGRRGILDGHRVRGLRLDARQPFRRYAAESVARLQAPPLVGRSGAATPLTANPSPGAVVVLRAARGAGGSRALLELSRALSHASRALLVGPVGASREPLGALRRALARALARAATPDLPPRLEEVHARLLAGEGAPLWAAAELVDHWLGDPDHPGIALVDDAAEVDRSSLEAIVGAVRRRNALRAVVRLGPGDPLPPVLADAAAVPLAPLPLAEAEELVHRFFGGAITPAAARRWARRGNGSPLAVREAICDGLESGALRWTDAIAAPRSRAAPAAAAAAKPRVTDEDAEPTARRLPSSALAAEAAVASAPTVARSTAPHSLSPSPSPPPPARRWIDRRIAHLAEGPRAVLTALALLGGEASDALTGALATAVAGRIAHVAAAERALVTGGWASRPHPAWLSLSSRTLRDALLAAIPDESRVAWHAAAARVLRQQAGALGLADAAFHAARAEDRRAAADLAARAARTAAAAKLEAAEAELLAFIAEQETVDTGPPNGPPTEAGDDSSTSPPTYRMPLDAMAELIDAPPSAASAPAPSAPPAGAPRPRFDTLIEGETPPLRPPPPPPAPAPAPAPPPPPPSATPSPPPPTLTSPEGQSALQAAARADIAVRPAPTVTLDPHVEHADPDPFARTAQSPVLSPDALADHLTELVKDAWIRGDLPSLERTLDELRRTGVHAELVDRMTGLLLLGRGAKGDAVRQLRGAAGLDQPPAQRARALLAYAVALAASRRAEAALLTALSALARAREAQDPHGEEACARFLARLSTAAGHPDSARAWMDLASRAGAARAD